MHSLQLAIGDKAPDFVLPNQDREPIQLSLELARQPVVLAFFPAAFSRVCTKEMCTFRDSFEELNVLPVKVLGISVDTFFSLKAWSAHEQFRFPLLSDFNKEVIAKYGVWNDDLYGMKGVAQRAVFLIDQLGVIRFIEILQDPTQEPNYTVLREAIETLLAKLRSTSKRAP